MAVSLTAKVTAKGPRGRVLGNTCQTRREVGYRPRMKLITGVVLAGVLAAGCGGGHKPDPTAAFEAATRSAWSTANASPGATVGDEQREATAWSAFAFTVGHLDAGKDTTQQGQLVTLAQQVSSAYSTHYLSLTCAARNSIRDAYESPQPCPQAPSGPPDDQLSQIAQIVRSL